MAAGIDTLQVSMGVDWGGAWGSLEAILAEGKARAEATGSAPLDIAEFEPCIALPGRLANYRYHVRLQGWDLFVAATPRGDTTPNVFVDLHPSLLWPHGAAGAVEHASVRIRELGGRIEGTKPSRVDLCADWEIPGGLSLDFLTRHRVGRATEDDIRRKSGRLRTFKVGADDADIHARIYHKGRRIDRGGGWALFRDIWGLQDVENVWRVEFEVQRRALRTFRIDTMPQLLDRAAGLWEYLTGRWLSFRLHDDANPTRRSVQPWWEAVRGIAPEFGKIVPLRRLRRGAPAPTTESLLRHIAGCMESYAARRGLNSVDGTLEQIVPDLHRRWSTVDFASRVSAKAVAIRAAAREEERADNV